MCVTDSPFPVTLGPCVVSADGGGVGGNRSKSAELWVGMEWTGGRGGLEGV
jgi:hypothetical protein